MDIKTAIPKLEQEWERPGGFLGDLRTGHFCEEGFLRVLDILRSVDTTNLDKLDKRFVELTWFIPTFMSWQRERVQESGGDVKILDSAVQQVTELLYQVLGAP